MDDAVAMGLVERVSDLSRQHHRVVRVERSTGEPRLQRFSFEKLQDEVVSVPVASHIVDGADVRVIELRDGPGFALEPIAKLRIGRQGFRQDFEGDGAIEPRVPCAR